MCARYEIDYQSGDLKKIYDVLKEQGKEFKVGEIFPSYEVPALVYEDKPALTVLKWNYGKDIIGKLIVNARSETVMSKPLFKADFSKRRVVLIASAFYEWDKNKRKYVFKRNDGNPLYLAGIADKSGNFTILTKDATRPVLGIHDRIPVILNKEELVSYLKDEKAALDLIKRDYLDLVRSEF